VSEDVINNVVPTEEGTQVNLINYNQLGSKGGFDQIQFSTFSPANPTKDQPKDDPCVIQSSHNSKSFSVLLNSKKTCKSNNGSNSNSDNNNGGITNKLSGGSIAGIVIGCVGAAIIGVALFHYRDRLHISYRLTKKNLGAKLKSIKSPPTEAP
ncbi:hypothetical protein CYY_010441, partial [Polysphondylium violaceum]